MLFFTSDNHFFHRSILKYCPNTRFGGTAEEMTWNQVDAINRVVRPNDELWFLGDFSFGDAAQTEKVLRAIQCKNLNLVWGNHDQVLRDNHHLQSYFRSIQFYKMLRWDNERYVMFHFPMREWLNMQRGAFHLYGHVHGSLKGEEWGRSMDVGVDARDDRLMEPWAITEVFNKLRNKEILAHHGKTMV